jgi:DNA-directed RNA polymerase beta' subunit
MALAGCGTQSIDPGAVRLVDRKGFRRARLQHRLAGAQTLAHRLLAGGRHQIDGSVAVAGQEGVEKKDRADFLRHAFCDAGDHHAAI